MISIKRTFQIFPFSWNGIRLCGGEATVASVLSLDSPQRCLYPFPTQWWHSWEAAAPQHVRQRAETQALYPFQFCLWLTLIVPPPFSKTNWKDEGGRGRGQGTETCSPLPSPTSNSLASSVTLPHFFQHRELLSLQRQEKLDLQVFLCGFFLKLKSQEFVL